MEPKLSVFIASASEGLDVAHAVRDALASHVEIEARVWNEDTFKRSLTFIESLEAELDRSDFAVVTLTPDDQSIVRGRVHMAPRDNVIFELGLFMGRLGVLGRLGRERTYFVFDKARDPKVPTDLLGVQAASFEVGPGQDLSAAVARTCAQLATRMKVLRHREKRTAEEELELGLARAFSADLVGAWWQSVTTPDDVRVSLCWIAPDLAGTTLRIEGRAMNSAGRVIAEWHSIAMGLRAKERTLFYSWKGQHGSKTNFQGFGQFTFFETSGPFEGGAGFFADLEGDLAPVVWKEVVLRRVSSADQARVKKIVELGSDAARRELVVEVGARDF